MFALLGGVLDREDGYLAGNVVHGVVDEIGVFARHHLAYAFGGLCAAGLWKKREILQAFVDCGADPFRGMWVSLIEVAGDIGNVCDRTRREAKLDAPNRRKAAATSASVANSPRRAWARPSMTSARCWGSTSSV